jgi:putative addiction module component (TIGR02574 family)
VAQTASLRDLDDGSDDVDQDWIDVMVFLSYSQSSEAAFGFQRHNAEARPEGREEGQTNMKTQDLIVEALSLPVEERARLVDSLLRSLNPPDSEIDKKWAAVAKRRLHELRSGNVKPVPGEEVFKRICAKSSK